MLWISITTILSSLLFAVWTTTTIVVAAEISYVMEPFEEISDEWFTRVYNNEGRLNLTTTEPGKGLYGERALRVEYQVSQTESWGGFVDFGWILNPSSGPAHNCHGATHLSLWYNILKAQSVEGRVHLRLILFDDSHCVAGEEEYCYRDWNYEGYYSFHYILDDESPPSDDGWKEIRVELRGDNDPDSPFWRTGWSGSAVGNDNLDLDHLRGWIIELSIDSRPGGGNMSEGILLLDQLSCVGGGDLLGAAFHVNNTFDDAVAEGSWFAEYPSPVSQNLSNAVLDDGMLQVNYAIDKYGGLLGFQHLAPSSAYYNLSGVSDVSLSYEILQAASVVGTTHFRIILMDGNGCEINCNVYPGKNLEKYYAFFYILDDQDDDDRSGTITVALQGDDDESSAFWRTGWTDKVGNNLLDASSLKGFRLEIYVENSPKQQQLHDAQKSPISGVATFGNMAAVSSADSSNTENDMAAVSSVDSSDTMNDVDLVRMMDREQVSYVMEPFEKISDEWFARVYNNEGRLNLTTTEPGKGLFGERALRVEYQVSQTENWGGFVDFGWIVNPSSGPAHNCHGATHLSLWYNIVKTQSLEGRVHLRLILLDDSHCVAGEEECYNAWDYETYYSFQYILDDESPPSDDGWKEIRVELRGDNDFNSPFWRTGWAGIVGNDRMDLDNLRGWRIELSIDSQAGMGNMSEGILLLDQLSCVGGGELIGAALSQINNVTFDDAVAEGSWFAEYPSSLSQNRSNVVLNDGILLVNYSIGMNESLSFQHVAPGSAYYNLSLATDVSLGYRVIEAASMSGRTHLRITLLDGSDCEINCTTSENLESYHTARYILDDDLSRAGRITIALYGEDGKLPSPAWQGDRTTGEELGNNLLELSMVKGYRLEIYADSENDIDSLVSGVVAIGNLTTLTQLAAVNDDGYLQNVSDPDTPKCYVEPDLLFYQMDFFRRVEFLGGKCCETCEADPNCLYGLSTGEDCYMASYVDPEAFGLLNTEFLQERLSSFWIDDATKRGDYCEVCECIESDRVIDCRGSDLLIVPKTFSPKFVEAAWKPRVLDLRGNPRLAMLGSEALASIAETIEEVRLPLNLRHLSFESLRNLPMLTVVAFEGNEPEGDDRSLSSTVDNYSRHRIRNVITESSGHFGDVCCDRGRKIDLVSPPEGLTFCDIKVDKPGVDAHYENYTEYYLATTLAVLRQSSNFMSEAAESPQKCAEYCNILNECMYFSYDARVQEAEHECHLYEDKGQRSDFVCCDPYDYADSNQTLPGWTSGYPPRTRNKLGARVLGAPRELVMDGTNRYNVQFTLSLGSTPLRGAVWIEPRVVSTTKLNVSISPWRVVLYDNKTVATVDVTVTNVDAIVTGETLVVSNPIMSCDPAFTSVGSSMTQENVYINVTVPAKRSTAILGLVLLFIIMVVLLFLLYFYMELKKNKADSAWKINESEVRFKKPPESIGTGTFGPVLLGEYHGTQVAVKCAFPKGTMKVKSSKKQVHQKNTKDVFHPEEIDYFPSNDVVTDVEEIDHTPSEEISTHSLSTIELGLSLTDGVKRSSLKKPSQQKDGIFNLKKLFCYRDEFDRLKAEFMAEMRHLSKLRHPCITTVMGAIMETPMGPKLVTEYMYHGSLYDLLRNETMDHREFILPILCDVTQGVRFLHATRPQVIHGDLKAKSILVDSRFRAKVTGFGLSQKTKHLGFNGSPYWMAPELLRGESENTTKSDVYAFGVTICEVYSRKDPYEGEEYNLVLKQLMNPLIQKRPALPSSCPSTFKSITEKCLDNCPNNRPSFELLDVQLKGLSENTIYPDGKRMPQQFKKTNLAQQQSDNLLFEVFPRHIAEALRDGRKVEPETHEIVTIFFSDIVGFTNISSVLEPIKVSDMLDRLYHSFDVLSRHYDVFKVETIGDAYMAVTNLIKEQPDHVKRIADFSIAAMTAANKTLVDVEDPSRGYVNIRIGFHSGPVVANVVGSRNPRYCLFGDTVNTASRMESNSMVNRILCSKQSAELLKCQDPKIGICKRGAIEIKGKGKMPTYWINEDKFDRRANLNKQFSTARLSATSVSSNGEDTDGVALKVKTTFPSRKAIGSLGLHGSNHNSNHRSTHLTYSNHLSGHRSGHLSGHPSSHGSYHPSSHGSLLSDSSDRSNPSDYFLNPTPSTDSMDAAEVDKTSPMQTGNKVEF